MRQFFQRLRSDKSGITSVEPVLMYALLLAFIAVISFSTALLGSWATAMMPDTTAACS